MAKLNEVVIVSSSTCLPYRDWEAKQRADEGEDKVLKDAGYKVKRIDNVPEEINQMLEVAKEKKPLAIVFESGIGSALERGYEGRKKKVLKKLKPIAEEGVNIISMNSVKLSESDAYYISALSEPTIAGNYGHGAIVLEFLTHLE